MENLHFQVNCDLETRMWKFQIKGPIDSEPRIYEFDHNAFLAIVNYALLVCREGKVDALPNLEIRKVDSGYEWTFRDAKLIAEGNQKLSAGKQKYQISRKTIFAVSTGYTNRLLEYLTKLVKSYEHSNN